VTNDAFGNERRVERRQVVRVLNSGASDDKGDSFIDDESLDVIAGKRDV
jgi:hypothetical protein